MSQSAIPVVVKRLLPNQWQVSYYREFEEDLFWGGRLKAPLENLIQLAVTKNLPHAFLREVVIEGFPFLCAIRGEEKTLYIGTRKLSRELALLSLTESRMNASSEEKELFLLREHVERMTFSSFDSFPTEIEWVTFENELPDFLDFFGRKNSEKEAKEVLDLSSDIAKRLSKKVSRYSPTFFERISDYGLVLTAQYDVIRIHVLKFLALLPSLDFDKTGVEVKRNLLESLRRLLEDCKLLSLQNKKNEKNLPSLWQLVFFCALHLCTLLPAKLLSSLVRHLTKIMARRFIAGETMATSYRTLRQLRATHREATLDQLGELVISAKEADEYFEKVLQLVHGFRELIPKGEKNEAGIYRAHVSIKVSALSDDFRPEAFEATYAKVAPRLKRILQDACREEVFINIDAEHYHYRDLVFQIYSKVLLETAELEDYQQTGIVVQAYLRDAAQHFREIVSLAQLRKLPMPIRLVKGAYWDAETIEGEAHQFIPPQFLNKEESDIHFRQLSYLALQHHQDIHLALASHNLLDHAFVEALRKVCFPSAPVIEHQCLHMTYEALSQGLAAMGWPTRNYMPIGNLLVGMAYLVRRIMENSSQVGVLSMMRSHKRAKNFSPPEKSFLEKKNQGRVLLDSFLKEMTKDFFPTRPLRMHLKGEREILMKEVQTLLDQVSLKQEAFSHSDGIKIFSSSRPELILGVIRPHSPEEISPLVDSLQKGLLETSWGDKSQILRRVAVLLKASDRMLLKRQQLAALIVCEAGKTYAEALADVDEAIDFINYYAREEVNLQNTFSSSQSVVSHRGVMAVIAPWNFPLAIPCGMVVAPLVAGNAVVLKPAEETPLIAQELYQLLISAGVPREVFALVLGDGESVGAKLVREEKIAGVVFTGSKNVGTWIYEKCAGELIHHHLLKTPLQKKVITEMGGKNAVIVTNNCEMDETISGIIHSAFGHAGQKCSATSRVIVHRDVKEVLIQRLTLAVKDLKVGESLAPDTAINPLIKQEDQVRVREAVKEARDEVIRVGGRILLDRSFEKLPGFCVGPALLEIPSHQAIKKDSWAQKEVFGPLIHIIEYQSLIEAVEIFNSTDYALTGGIYSQSQDDIDFLLKFLKAGNLYVNRPNTGARVAIEPFGGFKLSGTGPKAGGQDYLKQFHFHHSEEKSYPLDPSKITWAKESGHRLEVPKAQGLSLEGTARKFKKFKEAFFEKEEHLLKNLSFEQRKKLRIFCDYLEENAGSFLRGRHPHFTIPGQLSYNDKSMVKESALFVVISPLPDLKVLHYLFATISLGGGLSIACLTEESYVIWKEILDLLWESGFSKMNVDLSLKSSEEVQKLFGCADYSVVFADEFSTFHQKIYQKILSGDALAKEMRLILSEVDGVDIKDFRGILNLFVWERSFAINTMRHGAPLEMGP